MQGVGWVSSPLLSVSLAEGSLAARAASEADENAAFASGAWRGWALAVVFVAALLAFSASGTLAHLVLLAVEHPEARSPAALIALYFGSLNDPSQRAAFYGPLQLLSIVLIRSIAALGTVYLLRGLLPARSIGAFGFSRPTVGQLGFGVAAALLSLLAGGAVKVALSRFVGHDESPWVSILATHHGLASYLVDILQGAILSPIAEETLFRGLLFAGLAQRMPPVLAALISATLFGLFHLTPYALPALIVAGLVQAWVYYRTRNIWAAIVTHGVVNWIVFSLNYLHPLTHAT